MSRSIVVHAARAALLTVSALLASACSDDSTAPAAPRLVYGAAQTLGAGTARTFVAVDGSGKPVSVGVALSEAAMNNLPTTPNAPSPSAAMLQLQLPTDAPSTGFNHVMVDWNPNGHEPDQIYTLPHFDFHFYKVDPSVVMSIMPTDPQFATKAANLPAAPFVPTGYAAASALANITPAAATVPMMGLHWLATNSPELQPPPNNQQFKETFIYGSWDGKFIFLEPMITKAYLESLKNTAGMTRTVGTPSQVAASGYYPSSYSIKYDPTAKEYRVTLDALSYRQ